MITQSTRGSEWRKWDLHIHTPASYDYKDASVSNEEFIRCLAQNKISVIAVTDHHVIDVNRINEIRQISETNAYGITVLPGIEILSDARGSEPIHIIGIFSDKSDIDYIWRQIEAKTNISKIKGEGKNINEIYCDLNDTVSLIHNLGGIVTIHAGKKSNSIENIPHTIPQGDAQKKDIAEIVDVFEVGKEKDVKAYKENVIPAISSQIKKVHPIIMCSDNHDIKNYEVRQNCWIKANPTFEGLKQILYEPENRVCIQETKPEPKNDYQIIDSISFANEKMGKQKIEFNQNLNTIIGGRSSGKSVLLGCLAYLIDSKIEPKKNNNEYNALIYKLVENASVKWRDSTSETRKILYYSQSEISEIVRPNEYGISGINSLVEDIVKKDSQKYELLQTYDKAIITNRTEINKKINDFCELKRQIEEKQIAISNIGNKTGIIAGITKIEKDIADIKKSISGYLSDNEDKEFKEKKERLEILKQKQDSIHSDDGQITVAKDIELFTSLETVLSSFSAETHDKIIKFYNQLKQNSKESWINFLDNLNKENREKEAKIIEETNNIQKSELYKKGCSFNNTNELLALKEKSLQEEQKKKNEIDKIEKELEKLNQSITTCKKELWKDYSKYKE